MPSTTRREVPHAGSEVATLDALLQYCQETLLVKIDGLSEDDLRRPQVASGTTLWAWSNTWPMGIGGGFESYLRTSRSRYLGLTTIRQQIGA